jgi:serine/threonine protein kinase
LQANGTVWKRLKDPTNRDSMESFLAEIQLLSALSHGNIITGSGLDASGPASGAILAMEFVPGGTLQALLMRQMQGRPGSRLYRCRDALRCVSARLVRIKGDCATPVRLCFW